MPIELKNYDGSSIESAIPIEADNTFTGIRMEHMLLSQLYPGYVFEMQALIFLPDRSERFDRMTIITTEGEKKDVYFDITSFFGKLPVM